MAIDLLGSIEASTYAAQALAFERLLLVVKTQPITSNPPPRPRISDLRPVNENITVTHRDRPSDAHQRVPLEPLFHIDTEAQPAAQPMSIDEASEMRGIEEKAQTYAANGSSHAAEHNPAAQSDFLHDAQAGLVKSEVSSSVKTEDAGQVVPTRHSLCLVVPPSCEHKAAPLHVHTSWMVDIGRFTEAAILLLLCVPATSSP